MAISQPPPTSPSTRSASVRAPVKKTSTGAKMRASQDDQAGGTDSGDARQAWSRGYSEALVVRDGDGWPQVLSDLKAGRLVHLDVWHATAGGPCLSGTGKYGHTMAVAPEKNGSRWLVADPWCAPPKWVWWEESKLKAGAEEWGRRLREGTGGTDPRDPFYRELLRAVARRLMNESYPGHEVDLGPDPGDTGGSTPVMFTATKAQGDAAPVEDDMRFINSHGVGVESPMRINVGAGSKWTYLDGSPGGSFSADAVLTYLGKGDSVTGKHIVQIGTGIPYSDGITRSTLVLVSSTNKPYNAPVPPDPGPPTPPDGDHGDVLVRDAQWRAWLDRAPEPVAKEIDEARHLTAWADDAPDKEGI